MKKWTIDDSKELYNINGWGTSYFGINEKGDVYVTPCKNQTQIDIREVMDELALRDVTPPVLLRFPDILDNRIEKTWSCFKKAAEEYEYKGENYVVYPTRTSRRYRRAMPKRFHHCLQRLQGSKLYRVSTSGSEDGQTYLYRR